MQASLKSLLDVLGKSDTQYVIPVFQRTYSWSKRQCEQLWTDMMGANETKSMHFMGMLIVMPEEHLGDIGRASIIDGQQRLTTLTLILIALRDALREEGSEESLAKAKEIEDMYLETSDHECKVVLSEQDLPTLERLIFGDGHHSDEGESSFIIENLLFFRNKLSMIRGSLQETLPALEALVSIAIGLESDDSPQQVFESLNVKGKPLSTTDLIRNTLLVKFGSTGQEELFEEYWTPLDEAFAHFGKEQDIYLDAALHQWITEHGGAVQVLKRTDLYQAFKRHIEGKKNVDLEEMLKSISSSCLKFARDPKAEDARYHLDWVIDKPTGLISQRKVFGD